MSTENFTEKSYQKEDILKELQAQNILHEISNQKTTYFKWSTNTQNLASDQSKQRDNSKPLNGRYCNKQRDRKRTYTIDENHRFSHNTTNKQLFKQSRLPLVLPTKVQDLKIQTPPRLKIQSRKKNFSNNHLSVKQLGLRGAYNKLNSSKLQSRIQIESIDQEKVPTFIKPSEFFTGGSIQDKENDQWATIKNLIRKRQFANHSLKKIFKMNRQSENNLKISRFPSIMRSVEGKCCEAGKVQSTQNSRQNSKQICQSRKIGPIPINITRGKHFLNVHKFAQNLKTCSDAESDSSILTNLQ